MRSFVPVAVLTSPPSPHGLLSEVEVEEEAGEGMRCRKRLGRLLHTLGSPGGEGRSHEQTMATERGTAHLVTWSYNIAKPRPFHQTLRLGNSSFSQMGKCKMSEDGEKIIIAT